MKLTAVYSSRNPTQVQMMVGVLQSRGIPAIVTDQESTTMLGWPVKVRVHEQHVEAARAIVDEFLSAGEKQSDAQPWKCPGCGETIEPQFSDCWNCQTPRPGEGESALPPPRLPPDPQILVDLICIGCEYNLKSLAIDGRCPECGHPVLPSLLKLLQMVDVPADEGQSPAEVLRPCLDWFEAKYAFPIEAIGFVSQVWLDALAATADRDELSLAHAVRDQAADFFASPISAGRALERWNLDTPDKLARLIEWLIELKVVAVVR